MKKILSVMTSAAMLAACAITASAETNEAKKTTLPEDQDIGVNAKVTGDLNYVDAYSVTIEWGAMEFTYSMSGNMEWNTETHQYDYDGVSGWTASENEIKVTNDSSKAVNAEFTFGAFDEYDTVTGTFSSNKLSLKSALDGSAKSGTTALTLGGELSSDVTEFTEVGTVTVTLTEGSEE